MTGRRFLNIVRRRYLGAYSPQGLVEIGGRQFLRRRRLRDALAYDPTIAEILSMVMLESFDRRISNRVKCHAAFVFLAGCALWLFSHPYRGIWHDAWLYTLMALRWLDPAAYAHDPWFMFGSQDRFSMFSPLYGSLIALMGVDGAAKWGTLALGMGYVGSCWVFCRVLLRTESRYLAFLLLVSLQLVYCVNDFSYLANFRISESFLSSRTLAFSLSLFGLGLAIQGKKPIGFGILLVAMSFHPLIAIWPILILMFSAFGFRLFAVWAVCVVGVLLVAGLSLIGVSWLGSMSGDWERYVRSTARIVFVNPQQHRLEFLTVVYSLLYVASRLGAVPLRAWYARVLAVSFSAYLLFWFCSSYSPSALILQLQLWRGNWLALVFAVIAIVDLTSRAWRGVTPRRVLTIVIGTALLVSPWVAGGILVLLGSFPQYSLRLARVALRYFGKPRLLRLLQLFLCAALIGWLATLSLEMEMVGMTLVRPDETRNDPLMNFIHGVLFTGADGVLPVLVWVLFTVRLRWMTTIITILGLVLALTIWDVQGTKARRYNRIAWKEFAAHVKPGDVVYWQNRPLDVWYSLGTASYASSIQAIGIVFSERMTNEISRRLYRVTLAGADNDLIASHASDREKAIIANRRQTNLTFDPDDLHSFEGRSLTRPGLAYLCTDPALDYVVHDTFFQDLPSVSEVEQGSRRMISWHLYACKDVRGHL